MLNKKIIIIAGGSGGHIFPGLCIAKSLIRKGWKVRWITTQKNIENTWIPKKKIKTYFIKIYGLKNASLTKLIFSPLYILRAYYQINKIIQNWSPNIILGMGGYISGPGGVCAWRSKIPFILHEQNTIAGMTNTLLSKIATKNMQAFSGAIMNATVVGNPIRENIINIPPPIKRFKNRNGPLRLLIIGGSQGSKILNDILPQACILLKDKFLIWHQTGSNELKDIQNIYNFSTVYTHKTTCFIKKISTAYAWADIIICRSGALTVSEISTVGLGAIFVPYPHKDKQQYFNALALQKIGAAIIINQEQFNIKMIVEILSALDRNKLFIMAEKAYQLGIRNATSKITKIIENINNNISCQKIII